jgi:hypothetical protein
VEKFSFSGNFANASTGDSWFFQPIALAGLAVPEISPRPRVQPLDFGIPEYVQGEYRVELPVGMTVAGAPNDTSLETEFGSLHVEYSVNGNLIVTTERLTFTGGRIAPERYGAFREFINGIRRVEQVRLQAVKAP